MRAREILLLVLFVFLALFHREQVGATLTNVTTNELDVLPGPAENRQWRYDENSKFYTIVPERVRHLTSERPAEIADAVCRAMGGRADVIQRATPLRQQIGFNCAFQEPDLSMSVDFGDLRRITDNPQ